MILWVFLLEQGWDHMDPETHGSLSHSVKYTCFCNHVRRNTTAVCLAQRMLSLLCSDSDKAGQYNVVTHTAETYTILMLPNFSLKLKQISVVQYLQTDLLKDLFIEFSNKIGNYHEKNIKKNKVICIYIYVCKTDTDCTTLFYGRRKINLCNSIS